jgi:hypothetical protein
VRRRKLSHQRQSGSQRNPEDAGAEQNEAARRERETPRTKTDPPKTKKTPEPKRIQTARPTAGDEDCGEPKISEEVASIKPKPKDQTQIQIEIRKDKQQHT